MGHNDEARYKELEEAKRNGVGGALWDGHDFRQIFGGGGHVAIEAKRMNDRYSPYSGFHFHNFFANAKQIRFKYGTYGHANQNASWKPLREIAENLAMMHQCVMNTHGMPNQKWAPAEGGFDWFRPNVPIYFMDAEYRVRRHNFIRDAVAADDAQFSKK